MITPSYAPDFERAELLAESVKRFAPPELEHVLLIDRRDMQLFRKLEGPRTRLIEVESVLPWWIRRMPGAKRWWLSFKTMPIRNWALQQIVKLSAPLHVQSDGVVFADSDVTFVRPFTLEHFQQGGKIGLARTPYQDEHHRTWLLAAAKMLGENQAEIPPVNYIGNLITWRRETVLRLHEHLARHNGMSWQRVLAREWNLSEYMIYGLFCEKVLGFDAAGVYPADYPLLHLSWGYDLSKASEIERFFGDVSSTTAGVMLHSKDRIPVANYRAKIEALWAQTPSDSRV